MQIDGKYITLQSYNYYNDYWFLDIPLDIPPTNSSAFPDTFQDETDEFDDLDDYELPLLEFPEPEDIELNGSEDELEVFESDLELDLDLQLDLNAMSNPAETFQYPEVRIKLQEKLLGGYVCAASPSDSDYTAP